MVGEYKLDGVELDWEHPNKSTAQDYEKLVIELSDALNLKGKELTAALNGSWYADWTAVDTSVITGECLKRFSFINVMAYDMNNAIAKDQEYASKGLNFLGLDITWLDLGDDHIQTFSQMERFSEGIFTLKMSDETICFDTSRKIITTGDYDGVYEFSDGMAKGYKYLPRTEPYVPGSLMAPPGLIEGFIDREGNEVISLGELNETVDKFHEGFALIGGYEDKKGYINKTGEIEIFVFLFEIIAFIITVKEYKKTRTVMYVIIANLLSLFLGGYLITILPI